MSYQEFCQLADTPLTEKEWQSQDETPATTEELQWRKGFEVRRAIRHKRAGIATKEDLHLITRKTRIVVDRHTHRR